MFPPVFGHISSLPVIHLPCLHLLSQPPSALIGTIVGGGAGLSAGDRQPAGSWQAGGVIGQLGCHCRGPAGQSVGHVAGTWCVWKKWLYSIAGCGLHSMMCRHLWPVVPCSWKLNGPLGGRLIFGKRMKIMSGAKGAGP